MSEIRTPNLLDYAAKGFELGRSHRTQQARDGILAQYGKDPEKASGLLMQAGDFDGARSLQDYNVNAGELKVRQEEAQRKVHSEYLNQMLNMTESLKRVQYERRQEAFDNVLAPALTQMGFSVLLLDQMRQADKSDENLSALTTALGRKAKEYQLATTGTGFVGAFDKESGSLQTLREADAVQYQNLKNADGSETVVQLPKTGGISGGSGLLSSYGGGGGAAGAGDAGRSGFDAIYDGFIAPQEGGYTSSDGNGAPANFGINQKANPDVNVASLTPGAAREVYKQRYWDASGAANLPPALQAVHFDTAVNMGVGAAQGLLQQSGGDPQRYLQLREQKYRAIAQANPERAGALPTWLRRNQALGQFIGGGGSGAVSGGGGARAVFTSQGSKQQTRLMTPEEKAAYGIDASTPAQISPDGKVDVISGAKPAAKKVPVKAQAGFQANQAAITGIDQAIEMIRANPEAMGGANYLGDEVRQRFDTDGVKVRAAVSNIGGRVIHDRAGASQTVTEVKRLKPYVPNTTDRADVAITKLHQLRREYENEIAQFESTYGEDNGYAPLGQRGNGSETGSPQNGANMNPAQRAAYRHAFKPGAAYGSEDNPLIVNSEAAYNNLKPGTFYISPDGQRRRKGG